MDNNSTSLQYRIGGELEVNRMGYGCMQLTGTGVWGDPGDRESAKEVLKTAAATGVNFFDTADAYGPHTNEVLIREALGNQYDKLIIATKGGFERTGPGQWQMNGNPEYIASAIEGSLKRLQTDRIDLWQLHRIDPKWPVEETLAPVAEAVKAGKIRYVGLSEVSVEDIERARKVVPVVSIQNHYNLNERKWEREVDYTAGEHIAFIPWYPLASGPQKMEDKVKELAERHKATTAQIALAWMLHRSPNMLLIPGTKSKAHLQENMAAAQLQLSESDVASLSKI